MKDRLKAIKGIRDLKQAQELAMGVTGVLTDLIVKGASTSFYNYEHDGATVDVRGCWTEGGTLRLDITGLSRPGAPESQTSEEARDEG